MANRDAPNQIYETGYYNEYQKLRFLKGFENEGTRNVYSRVLSRAKRLEEQFGYDLYNFNLYEIEKLLNYLSPASIGSSRGNIQVVQQYIRWAIQNDLRDNNIHPLDALLTDEFVEKFVDPSKQDLLSKTQIDRIVAQCANAQDYVIVRMLFEGIYGKGYDELLNLQESDINYDTNLLRLTEDNETRRLMVSDECLDAIRKAINQTEYEQNNGKVSPNLRTNPIRKLTSNSYVLKSVDTDRAKSTGKQDSHLVLRRLKTIKETLNISNLTTTTIRKSGMLYMAYQLYNRDGDLTRENLNEIGERFNISKFNVTGGKEDYNMYAYKKEFLNVETIKEVYNEDPQN